MHMIAVGEGELEWSLLTFEFDVYLTVDELIALQDFTEATPFPRWLSLVRLAEGQVVVVVCFLRVVVGPDLVDP